MERNCIIMAPVPMLIKEWRRAVSRNRAYQFYDVAQPGEFAQLIGVLDSSIIFVTDIKVCKEILVKNKKYTKSNRHRVILINDKQIPMRIYQKFQKVGLDEQLSFKTPLKTLNFKVDIFFKNLEKEQQEKDKELKRKKLAAKKIDNDSAQEEMKIKSLIKSEEESIRTTKEADKLSRPSHWEGKDREDKHLEHDPLKGKVYFGEEEIDGTLEGLASTEHQESEELGLDVEPEEIEKNWSGYDHGDNEINHENLEMEKSELEDYEGPLLEASIDEVREGTELEMEADSDFNPGENLEMRGETDSLEYSNLEMDNSNDEDYEDQEHLDENEKIDEFFEGLDLDEFDETGDDEPDETSPSLGTDFEEGETESFNPEDSELDDPSSEDFSDSEDEDPEQEHSFDYLSDKSKNSVNREEPDLDYLKKEKEEQVEGDFDYSKNKQKKDYGEEESFYEKDEPLNPEAESEEKSIDADGNFLSEDSNQDESFHHQEFEEKTAQTEEEKFEEAVNLLRSENIDLEMNDEDASELAEIIFEIEEEAKEVRQEQYQDLKEEVITYEEIDFDIAETNESLSKLDSVVERNEEYENYFNLADADNLVEYQFNFLEGIEDEEVREETSNVFDIPQRDFIPQSLFHFDYLYFISELFRLKATGAEQKILKFTKTYFLKKNSEYFNYFFYENETYNGITDGDNDPLKDSDFFTNLKRESIEWDVSYEVEDLKPETKFLYFPYFAEKELVGALVFGYTQEISHEEKVKMEALFLTTRCFFC